MERKPVLELRRLHHDGRSDHAGMIRSAILRTEEVVRSWTRRLKPDRRIAVGQDVHMHAEVGDEKAVNHVFRRQQDLHGPTEGQVQHVDLALPLRVLELPHPLFADGVDAGCLIGCAIRVDVNDRTPQEHHDKDAQRRNRPEPFQCFRRMRQGRRRRVAGPPAIADAKIDQQTCHHEADRAADGDQKEKQRIDVHGRRCRLLGKHCRLCQNLHRRTSSAASCW